MRMSNGGVYREFKYGKKIGMKKYVVVTITADAKRKKLLNFDVRIEGESDSEPKSAVKHIGQKKQNMETGGLQQKVYSLQQRENLVKNLVSSKKESLIN